MEKFIESTNLNEGGKAVPNVGPIKAEHTLPTLQDLERKILTRFLRLGKSDYAALGSTGKKLPGQSSGDIDVAVDIKKIAKGLKVSEQEVGKTIMDILDKSYPKMDKVFMKGLNIISLAYPIKGGSGNVQVDLMLQDDIKFAKWMFHSPDFTKNESEWKGLYRTELLKAISYAVSIPELTEYFEDDPKMVKKLGRNMLDPTKGYKKNVKSFVGKTGKPVKSGKTEFEEVISKDPEFITKALLGKGAKVSDTNSFESVWKAMGKSDFPWKDNKKQIVEYFADVLKRKGLPYPKELGISEKRMVKISSFID